MHFVSLIGSLFCFGLWEEESQIESSETLVFDSECRQLGSELNNCTDRFLGNRHKENGKAEAKQRSGISCLGEPQMGHFTMMIHGTRIIEVKQQNSMPNALKRIGRYRRWKKESEKRRKSERKRRRYSCQYSFPCSSPYSPD